MFMLIAGLNAVMCGSAFADEATLVFAGGTSYKTAFVATDVTLPGTSDFTWDAWVKPTDVELAENRIMGQTDWANEGRLLLEIRKGNDSGKVAKFALLYRVNVANKRTIGTTQLVAGTWYHVAVTRSGTAFSLYVNGTLEATANDYVGPLPDVPFSFAHMFSGALAEVRAWNRALSAEEIAAVKDRRVGGTENGLVGCWALNNGMIPYNRVTGAVCTVSEHEGRTFAIDPSLDLSDGVPAPIARWSMEEIAVDGDERTVADLSGNDRTLLLASGCTLTDDALEGKGLSFNGTATAYALFDSPEIGSRSMSFWVKLDADDGPVYYDAGGNLTLTYPYLFGNFGRTRLYYRTGADNDGYLAVGSGTDANNRDSVAYTSSVGTYLRKTWNYLTLTYDQADTQYDNVKSVAVKLYANGYLLHDFGTLTVTNGVYAQRACLGCNGGSGVRPMKGVLDEVEAYDCALTAEQVLKLYLRHHVKPPAELLASWDMDEVRTNGANRYVADGSGNGFDLYLRDGVTATNGVAGGGLSWNGYNTACTYAAKLFPPVSDWSWSGWVRKSKNYPEDTATYKFQRLYSWGSLGYITFGPANSELWFNYHAHNTTRENKPGNIFPSVEAWSHFVLSVHNRAKLDGSGFETYADWYVNGKKGGESPVYDATQLRTPPYRFLLGCNNQTSGSRIFSGAMDAVRVYAGAISAETAWRLYLQPAHPDAGTDFTTARETATLRGRLLDADGMMAARSSGGTSKWSLVSAPIGVDGVRIDSPNALETTVALPAAGTYVFRLTATADAACRTDDVTVTRVAAPAANAAPTVTIAASAACLLPGTLAISATATDADAGPGTLRVAWHKVEGPGAAYFDDASAAATRVMFTAAGTYVLEVAADDGLAAAFARQTVTVTGSGNATGVTNGLVHHWTLDAAGGAGIGKDLCGTRDLGLYNGATVEAEGYVGYGARFNAENASAQTDVQDYPTEMADAISASCWIYEDTTESYYATARVGRLLSYHTDFEIQHNKEASSYFQVRTKYPKDGGSYGTVCWFFAAPTVPIANRWAHVAVTASLGATSDSRHAVKLYVDGVEMALTKFQFPEGTNIGENSAQPYYPGTLTDRARIFWGCANGQYRVFPGVIDEMRIYNRILSASEVQSLAAGGAFLNRAPQVAIAAGASVRATIGKSVTIDPGAYDDGLPAGSTLAGAWRIVAGDASAVALPEGGNDFVFLAQGEYGLVYEVTDGERTTVSPALRVEVAVDGTMLFIR